MRRNLKTLSANRLLEYYYQVQSGQKQVDDKEREALNKEFIRRGFRELSNGELEFILHRLEESKVTQ